jgi:hypothetical protein
VLRTAAVTEEISWKKVERCCLPLRPKAIGEFGFVCKEIASVSRALRVLERVTRQSEYGRLPRWPAETSHPAAMVSGPALANNPPKTEAKVFRLNVGLRGRWNDRH